MRVLVVSKSLYGYVSNQVQYGFPWIKYIYIIYIYLLSLLYIYIYIYANFIKHNRHFMSTHFLLDPFEFPYYFYQIRGGIDLCIVHSCMYP